LLLTASATAQEPALDAPRIEMLVKSTLIALNQANLTGNYTVLRDLGTPQFRDRNDSAQLGAMFASFRQGRIDLTPVIVLDPALQGNFDPPWRVRLSGSFPTRPLQIEFDLLFELIGDNWLLDDLTVRAVATGPVPQPPAETSKETDATSDPPQ